MRRVVGRLRRGQGGRGADEEDSVREEEKGGEGRFMGAGSRARRASGMKEMSGRASGRLGGAAGMGGRLCWESVEVGFYG